MELNEIRSKVQSFTEEISKEYYLQGSGLKEKIDLDSIYRKYPDLFSRKNLMIINDAFRSSSNDREEHRKLGFLLEAFYGEVFGHLSRDKRGEYLNRESEGKIITDENKILSYRSSWVHMVNEADREKRDNINKARNYYIEQQLNPILENLFYIEQDYIRELGFSNKIEMFKVLTGIDVYKICTRMNQLVTQTEDVYKYYLSEFAIQKLKIPSDDLCRHDILFLLRDREYDNYFAGEVMLQDISSFMSKMGIDTKAGGNINYDLEPRQNKSPRAFCCTVRVPQEIYLVLYPHGGLDDYAAFLHELGHALHFANVSPDIPFEYKWYGDNSVTEGYAMTFDHLILKDSWIKKYTKLDEVTQNEYIKRNFFKELVMLRRYAAKINYEIKLNENCDLRNKKELYCETFEAVTKIKYPGEYYLEDVDSFFYCARYIRAWMFQAGLHSILTNRFGENWFESVQAGDFLKSLWSSGQQFNADEVLESCAGENLSIQPLVEEIKRVLEF